jgi:hypothetical protein
LDESGLGLTPKYRRLAGNHKTPKQKITNPMVRPASKVNRVASASEIVRKSLSSQ